MQSRTSAGQRHVPVRPPLERKPFGPGPAPEVALASESGADPGKRQSPSPVPAGRAWGWSVSSSTTTLSPSSSSSSIEGAGRDDPSPSCRVPLQQRETKLGPRAPQKDGVLPEETRWVGRVLGAAWTRPGVELHARACEARDILMADVAPWLASIHDDPQVPVPDAMVCAALLARRLCRGLDSAPWFVMVDAIVAASLRAHGQERLDKATAMLVGLCRAQEGQRLQADECLPEGGWPRMDMRVALGSRLTTPCLPAADLERHVREGHGQRLVEAVMQALCPPRAGQGGKASPWLPSIAQVFDACAVDLGFWCLARGVEAHLRGQAPASSTSAQARVSPAQRPGDWPLPLALGVPLAPLATAQDPKRLMTQAMLVMAIYKAAYDAEEQTGAILDALRARLLIEGPDWPVPLLMAAACGFASACLERESDDEESEAGLQLLESELDALLALPQAAGLPEAARQAIAQGYALAEDALGWLVRRHQPAQGLGLDDDTLCQLMEAALAVRGVVPGAFFHEELSGEELAQARPGVAIPTIGFLLRHGMLRMDFAAQSFQAAGRQLVGHLQALAGTVERLSARLQQLDGKAGRLQVQARHEQARRELAEARLLWIPAVYRDLASGLRQRWAELGHSWIARDRRHHASEVRKAAQALREAARVWQEEAKASLRGQCDHLPGVLDGCAGDLDALAADLLKGLEPEVPASTPGEQAFERALKGLPLFERIRRADPDAARRLRTALLGLLRMHDALSDQVLAPHRAAALLRAADLRLPPHHAQVAAGVIARMCRSASGMSEACMDVLVSTALALAGRGYDGKEGKEGKEGKDGRAGMDGALDPGRTGGLLSGIWFALQSDDADADVTAIVFISIVARQLAHQPHPWRMGLVATTTAYLLADAGPVWQDLFLRELMTSPRPVAGPPGGGAAAGAEVEPRQHDFLAVTLALHDTHRGLADKDWRMLLDHLQDARMDDASALAMCQALLLGAAGRRLERTLAAAAQMVRQLSVRPGPLTAQGRLARLAFDGLRLEKTVVAGATVDKAWPPQQVFEDLMLGMVRAPAPAARLVALMTLALRHLPGGLQQVRQWLFDTVAAIDATLVVAELDAIRPQAQAHVAAQRSEARAQVEAFGAGHAFALAMDRTPALEAQAVREVLTLPASAGVQSEIQEALWRGGRQALEAISAGRNLAGLAEPLPPGAEGSKSRRAVGGPDRQDPPDPGYSGKRKKHGAGKPLAPLPSTVIEDQEAARQQAQFTQALQAFSAGLANPSIPLPLSAPRKALAQWVRQPVRGERSMHAFAGTGVALAASGHPADADGVGWQLEQVFQRFVAHVDAQVLAWHRAGHDLAALAQRVEREMQRWRTLGTPHARGILPLLRRAHDLLLRESRNPRPRPASAEARVPVETKVSGETQAAALPSPLLPQQLAGDGDDEIGNIMDDEMERALAMSLADPSAAGTRGDAEFAEAQAWPQALESGARDAMDLLGPWGF